jgi:hypothetical protein
MKANKPGDKKLSKHERKLIDKLMAEVVFYGTNEHLSWISNLYVHSEHYYNSPISQRQRIRLYELKRTYLKKK